MGMGALPFRRSALRSLHVLVMYCMFMVVDPESATPGCFVRCALCRVIDADRLTAPHTCKIGLAIRHRHNVAGPGP